MGVIRGEIKAGVLRLGQSKGPDASATRLTRHSWKDIPARSTAVGAHLPQAVIG